MGNSSSYGVVEAGAIFGIGSGGKLAYTGAMRVVSLEVGSVAPGVPTWRVTFDTEVRPVPHFGGWFDQSPVGTPFFAVRLAVVSLGPGLVVDLYLIDGTGTAIDPASLGVPDDTILFNFHVVTTDVPGTSGQAP